MADESKTALLDIANNGAMLNQAISELSATVEDLANITLPVANGGTGANNATAARSNLGLGNAADLNTPITVVNGGTGQINLTSNGVLTGNGTNPLVAEPLFVCDDSGNVGIGNAAPTQKLDVTGNAAISGNVRVNNVIILGNQASTGTDGTTRFISTGSVNYIQSGQNTNTGSSAELRFTNINANSTWARILSDGRVQCINTISVGDAVPSSSGAGITFPATQSASSNTNTLDDYEEGTFSPTVIGSTVAGTATYTIQNGRYTKIGRLVQFEIYLIWSGGTGTGSLYIANLPFVAGGASYPACSWAYPNGLTIPAGSNFFSYVQSGASFIILGSTPSGGGGVSQLPYDAASEILLSGTYSVG